MRVLIFGGSFNPVHWGHLILAEELREEFAWDRVLFIPACQSPFKDGLADPGPEHRLAMLKLACAGNPAFLVDDREIRRGGHSWTIDTLRSVAEDYRPDGVPGLVVGDDLVEGFDRWRDREALRSEARIIVARRSATAIDAGSVGESAANRLIPISSSEIRERVAVGKSVRYLLHPEVLDYILEKGLYGSRAVG